MQYSFKLDLEEKRRRAKAEICENKAEQLFRSFANLIAGCYESKELLSSREIVILINRKDIIEPITVTISTDSITKEDTLIELREVFTEITFKQVVLIFEEALQSDGLKYDYCDNLADEKEDDSNSKENEISDSEEEAELFARFVFRI